MSKRRRFVVIFGTGIALLFVISAIAGGGSSDKKDEAPAAQVTTSTTEEDKEETKTATTPEPPDTGRMSAGEIEEFKSSASDWESEVLDYANGLAGKCATIASAGQAAEFFDCEEDAYDGVIGQYGLTDDTWKGLRDDVAKTCKKSLNSAIRSFNNFADAVAGTHELVQGADFTNALVTDTYSSLLRSRSQNYKRRYLAAAKACRPA